MNNSYITIIKEKRTVLSRKRVPLNQNECTADFRIGVPFEQNLHFISQPIYIWAFDLNLNDIIYSPNILFTLAYGAVVICFLQNKQYIYCLFLVIASLFVNLDYGVMGIGLIILFYVFREKRLFLLIVCGCYLASEFIGSLNIQIGNIYINAQGFSVLSIPIIAKEVAFKPRINKYFFYLYYPLHLLLLGIIWHIAN